MTLPIQPNDDPNAGWPRRDFLKTSAAALFGLTFTRLPAMAGPFTRADFNQLVPADKKLTDEWVKSLFARGDPEVLRGSDLKYVGMPIGGIGAGQLYLGGDGRLWHWDIFNQHVGTGSEHYAKPLIPDTAQILSFRLRAGDKVASLDRTGFSEISFRGEYPIGVVEYAEAGQPLRVKLEAFSPFLPLNTDDSGLPATILQFTVRNTAAEPRAATLTGEIENAICLQHRARRGLLANRFVKTDEATLLVTSASSAKDAATPDPANQKEPAPIEELPDFGTMVLAVLGDAEECSGDKTAPFNEHLSGSLGRKLALAPGEAKTVTFVLAWHFPNLSLREGFPDCGRFYATKFSSAQAVAEYVVKEFPRLESTTKLWRDTWYDSTLPFWFLDRTFLNTSILATSTCYRFANGRFYGWEGVGCCEGTCGHV